MLDKSPLALSSEFRDILLEIESSNESMFITGRAGTGKSTLLQLIKNTTKKRIAVVAPTGVAALNVRGQTIHSFFKLPPNLINADDIKKTKDHKLYKNIDCLIIDEISMVRADVLDSIDVFLRKNREKNEFFGGVQVVFFGDLFQLPPVVSTPFEKNYFNSYYESPYFFSAKCFEYGFKIRLIELTKVYRQEERFFIDLLDKIRLDEIDIEDLEALNERYKPLPSDADGFITLCTINATANALNLKNLHELTTPPTIYKAKVEGSFMRNVFPTDENLVLKVGAQVMFVKNDPQKAYVNGTIGEITEIKKDGTVIVKIRTIEGNSKFVNVERMDWEMIKYSKDENDNIKTEIVGNFNQLPLKLAWAVTIHKSQGKTFDQVIIDLGRGAFEYGQTYVALSRCRTLGGIYLKAPIKVQDIKSDDRVKSYYDMMRRYF